MSKSNKYFKHKWAFRIKKERLYYMRDTRNTVGNCVMWWRKGNAGYTCDLNNAAVYEHTEAMHMHKSRNSDVPYPKDYIDGITTRHVDHQVLDHLEYAKRPDLEEKERSK